MFGSNKRKERKAEKLKIEKLKKTISSTQMGRGASKNRQDAKKELNRMGHLTDRQKSQKDRKDRKAYDREHTKKNKRGRVVGYKEGYDESKGIKGLSSDKSSKSSKSKSKATMTGRERAQQMAKDRIAAKKAGTYKKPKTAQELAKERLAKKNKKK